MGKTLVEKVWDEHVVRSAPGEPDLLYIDLHLIHEVTSPQAFDGLRLAGRQVRRPDLTLATEDHNVPTIDWDKPIADPVSKTQVDTLRKNAAEFGVRLHPLGDVEQGIVHVVGPQLGLTQTGHDDRLRRQPHQHPRRLRRDRLRHRHLRGRARARHPDADAGEAEDDGRHDQRIVAPRCHRQGHGADPDHPHRHRWRTGLHRGIPRPGHRGALHGGPDDGLQHEHRVGRQGGPDRSRPDHLRLHRGQARSAEGRRLGRRRRPLEDAWSPTPTPSTTRRSSSTRRP